MRYAEFRIADGVILNIIVVNDGDAPPPPPADRGHMIDDGAARIGGIWDGVAFLPPPVKTPAEIDAERLAQIAAQWTATDTQIILELVLMILAALKAGNAALEAEPYFPAWLAGVTTETELIAAIAARQREIEKGNK